MGGRKKIDSIDFVKRYLEIKVKDNFPDSEVKVTNICKGDMNTLLMVVHPFPASHDSLKKKTDAEKEEWLQDMAKKRKIFDTIFANGVFYNEDEMAEKPVFGDPWDIVVRRGYMNVKSYNDEFTLNLSLSATGFRRIHDHIQTHDLQGYQSVLTSFKVKPLPNPVSRSGL